MSKRHWVEGLLSTALSESLREASRGKTSTAFEGIEAGDAGDAILETVSWQKDEIKIPQLHAHELERLQDDFEMVGLAISTTSEDMEGGVPEEERTSPRS